MNNNPLTVPIARILHQNPEGLTEYELLTQLEFEDWGFEHDSAQLVLFRKHFLIMNALYSLQAVLWEEGYELSISPLHIVLRPVVNSEGSGLPTDVAEQTLRDYYLDWGQFEQTTNDCVQQLLDSFWKRYYAEDQQREALAVLQLEADCSLQDVRAAYRRLVALHHPDRGGQPDQFRRVREAYELIACWRG